MSQKVTTGVRPTLRIADKNQIPATEPERQYYFMDIAKEYLRQLSEEKGNPLTFHVSTFGCPIVWVNMIMANTNVAYSYINIHKIYWEKNINSKESDILRIKTMKEYML